MQFRENHYSRGEEQDERETDGRGAVDDLDVWLEDRTPGSR
jgi:hypothetical protein